MRPPCKADHAYWIAWLLLPVLGIAQPVSSSWPTAADFERDDVALRVDDDGRFRGHIELAIIIDTSPEQIWEILLDCASAVEYVPHVESCDLVETLEEGRAEIFEQRIRYTWFLPAFDHVFRLDYEPYSSIIVTRVDGPFERLEGRWTLEAWEDGRTLLSYVLDFAPGMPVPRFFVARAMLRDLPEVLRQIRRRAEDG